MKSLVGVYEMHDEGVWAIERLKAAGYSSDKLSLLAKADMIDNHIHIKRKHTAEVAEVSIGMAAGAVLGTLSGVGVFLVPGLGFFYGAGAIVGLFAGLDFGLIGGGIAAILTAIGIDEKNAVKYEHHLNEGKFLVFVQDTGANVKKAEELLGSPKLEMELGRN